MIIVCALYTTYLEPDTNMRVLMTSSGLVMVVVTRPAIIDDVKWVTVPSDLDRGMGNMCSQVTSVREQRCSQVRLSQQMLA
jgi:hypothetical protein